MRWQKPKHEDNNGQASIFDQAEKLKQEGINLSYNNANTTWKRAAGDALVEVAKTCQEFTTDQLWATLAKQGIHTGENRAMGAIMQAASRAGMVEGTGRYKETVRPEGHKSPKRIWKSKIYKGQKNETHNA